MKTSPLIVASLSCVVLAVWLGGSAKAVELTVKINGVENGKGKLRVSLYNDSEGWANDMESEKTENAVSFQKVKPKKGTTTVVFKDVEAGRFAVTLYHDKNDNEEIDKKKILGVSTGIPDEGFGFSNNANPVKLLRAPRFSECQFEVKEDESKTIEIKIQ